jgi:hypothetical protein
MFQRPLLLLLCSFLAATVGCSAKVDVRSETWDRTSEVSTGEKSSTAVEVDVLQTHAAAPSPTPAEPKPNTSGNTVIIQVNGGDVHVHEPPPPAEPASPKKSTLNTKIGLPSTYSAHGPSVFLGSVAVWGLVGIAIVLMVENCGRSDGGPLFSIIGLLVLAAVVLQFLPATESGIQFLPLSPWSYSGFLAVCLSLLCWAGLLAATLVIVTGCSDSPTVFSVMVLFSMGLNALLSFGGGC